MPIHVERDFVDRCRKLVATLERVERERRLIVVLDEIVFTKRSIQARDYSGRNTNLSVDQSDVYTGYRKVIATVTEGGGIDYT